MRKLVLPLLLAAAVSFHATGRAADSLLQSGLDAWDRGQYVEALKTYLQILDSPAAADAFETIALQTGELFQTVELTADGDAPAFSSDGRHMLYETGALPDRRIRVMAASEPRRILFEVPGHRAVFSPDGTRLAYLKITVSPALRQAYDAVDQGPPAQRTQRLNAFNTLLSLEAQVTVRDLVSGTETTIDTGRMRKTALAFTAQDVIFAGAAADGSENQLYVARAGGAAAAVTAGEGEKTLGAMNRQGTALTYTVRGAGGGRGGGAGAPPQFGLLRVDTPAAAMITGSAPAFSADGATLAYVARDGGEYRLMTAPVADPRAARAVRTGTERIDAPAFSPDGSRLAFQMMPKEDWEIFIVGADGSGEARLTREIQHDVLPRFVGGDRIIAMIGEARHRRSHLYDLASAAPWQTRTRLFHNNTVRTIAPEYEWVPSPDGRRLLVVAERDGDTVSPERGVYLVDLSTRITTDDLRARLKASLAHEEALRATTRRQFAPIADDVRRVLDQASVGRVYEYQKALFDFDSKYVTQPGNRLAAQYLFDTYRSFGYEPAFQEFQYRTRDGRTGPTANVLATLRGTVNPELVYVVSSHYDSVAAGPGADDDSSGTAALLETARILAKHPQAATIVFASFTGEEAGLLGSREYVRQAVERNVRIVGALNNDMIGWANDHRLDNTIRYSNAGIRDIQHGAAMHFTRLITYDALYYKSTDAAAYYEAYGDIVGGIGSYPVLGNPHYHQPHDLLDTINHQLVTEVAKTTAATLMYLASSPSRLAGLTVERASNGSARVSWTPSPEQQVTEYIVTYGRPGDAQPRTARVKQPGVTLNGVAAGDVIAVKGVNARGLEGWDWARAIVR
ncbi:MAG TPA: M20/M25/M40 family metallo-hydrolase [Vicinamibacterales bacterium]|nr:M20/M25/M40 family metallo-hydrolase [Vicinamibacterales bacterium]